MRARAALSAALIATLALPGCGPRWYYEARPAPVPEMPRAPETRSEVRARPDATQAIRLAEASFPGCEIRFGHWVDWETVELLVCASGGCAPVGYRWQDGEPHRLGVGDDPFPSTPPAYAPPPSGSGRVHVRGYYRRDGTYVRPHTRSRPR